MRLFALIVGVTLLACGVAVDAAAQAANTSANADLPIAGALAAFATVLSSVVIWAVRRVTGVQLDDRAKAVIETAMQNGLAYGLSRAGVTAEAVPVSVKSQVLATALSYVTAHAPDAAKRLGVDLRDPSVLRQMLEARLARRELDLNS